MELRVDLIGRGAAGSRRPRPDAPVQADINHRRIRDEGHRNRMTFPELNERKDKRQAMEDVFWAIVNSRDFMFNH